MAVSVQTTKLAVAASMAAVFVLLIGWLYPGLRKALALFSAALVLGVTRMYFFGESGVHPRPFRGVRQLVGSGQSGAARRKPKAA